MISDTLIRTRVVFFIFMELFGKNAVYTYEVLKREIYEKAKKVISDMFGYSKGGRK